jgi:hypothetical protein
MNPHRFVVALLSAVPLFAASAPAAAATFVYEGRLDDGGAPANGRYDLRLSPFADAKSGAALAAPIVFEDVPVVDGRFRIDFDLPLASAGAAWIEVGVRDGSAVGAFSTIPGRSEAAAAKAIGACWSSTGDSATNPAVNFLGTTDAQPLVLRVQNQQVARYEPSSQSFNGAPITANVVMGSPFNGLFTGVRGAVIAGGGVPVDSDPLDVGEGPNRVNDDFGTIGGGYSNLAGDDLISPQSALAPVVGGGIKNQAAALLSTIGGGLENIANGQQSTIAGGSNNTTSGLNTTIGGGTFNLVEGSESVVAGGGNNAATGVGSTVSGGFSNEILGGSYGVVSGGRGNEIAAGSGGDASAIAGGADNLVAAGVRLAFVGGGRDNVVTAPFAASVLGGAANQAAGQYSTASGGLNNCAGGNQSWAGGFLAKVRPPVGTSSPQNAACAAVANSGDANGDEGTFVWNAGPGALTSTGPNQFLIGAPGGAAINSNDPAGNALRVNGTLRVDTLGTSASTTLCRNASNQISGCSSSARYKEHITDLDLGLAVVERLRPVAYAWKSTHEADIGFVAEEIAAIDPRLVTRNAAGEIEGVKYDRLTAVLAAALQESNARVTIELDALRAEAADLRSEAAELRDAAARRDDLQDERLRSLEALIRRAR